MSVALTGGAATALADGDAAAGEKFFKTRCTACHTADEGGKNKAGPNLFGVFGGTAGARVASFEKRHSKALKASGIVWDEETLDGFLENPKKYLKGVKMNLKVSKEDDRENVIAYLQTLTK
ncbi:MAG: c-type cytochrome [Alphaproteobacteria bacterium]|nr:c-type cytochrome [Alphaproteobacteria bacterium]